MKNSTNRRPPKSPIPKEIKHHIWAFLEASFAPAMSPIANLLFTWEALTIATIPVGKKQKMVTRTGEYHVIGDINSCSEWLPDFLSRACLLGGVKIRPAVAASRRIICIAC